MFGSHSSYLEEEANFLSELLVQQVGVVLVVQLVLVVAMRCLTTWFNLCTGCG